MPPAQSKSVKRQTRSKPYDVVVGSSSSATSATRRDAPSATILSPSNSQSDADIVAHFSQTTPYREICHEKVAKFFPKYTPRDDFELLALACWFGKPHNATDAQIAAYLKEEWRIMVMESGVERAHQKVQMRLEEKVQMTGLKPTAKTRHVYTQPLPGCKYSLRLYPGNYHHRAWTMDFVLTATGQPVNSPFEFKLMAAPNPKSPWLFGMGGRIKSLETKFGVKQNDIYPGEEKFLLQDGQTCLLTRPGKRTVRFTVPIRPLPEPKKAVEEDKGEYDDLVFPEVLSPSDP